MAPSVTLVNRGLGCSYSAELMTRGFGIDVGFGTNGVAIDVGIGTDAVGVGWFLAKTSGI
ncbi:hypothetical protein GC102_20880 [Paenibacillus sp. LMG 31460]|uniref:Uncharacterized protein n=1 Tax=Paenibacillus germinis TaxID=2654979 RepID=A0ABX1Z7E0_9BACL|nr:hypothetical protein [Paenibacillus germinis]NOU88204.1 hypothetical protein [Paenibacillus germinis]